MLKYFNKSNLFYHGIMFHHFHDEYKNPKYQGSINKDQLYKIIKYIGKNNILNADEFQIRLKEAKLMPNNVCFTFDDGLKSQYDIALPLLEDLKIKSFFFVYTSIFDEIPDFLEIYRYFRVVYYENVDSFYKDFFYNSNIDLKKFFDSNTKKLEKTLKNFPFYSLNDAKFRILRDFGISKKKYHSIMIQMFRNKKFNYKKITKKLFITTNQFKTIHKLGHYIGLHSHTHPTLIENLDFKKQYSEYKKNLLNIKKILNYDVNIKFMSHPNGSYNKNTLKILKELNLELGFRSSMIVDKTKKMKKINNSKYEIAREDHSNIIYKMNE